MTFFFWLEGLVGGYHLGRDLGTDSNPNNPKLHLGIYLVGRDRLLSVSGQFRRKSTAGSLRLRTGIAPPYNLNSYPSRTMSDPTVKGLPPPPKTYDGSSHRIAIVHARWNDSIIKALVAGCIAKLKEQGVKEENIVVKSVPGSYELPFACSKWVLSSSSMPTLAFSSC